MTGFGGDVCQPGDRRQRAQALLNALLARYGINQRGDEYARLVDTLFVNAEGGIGWLTGVSELSVSLRADRPVAIRCLSEIVQRRTLDSQLSRVGLEWGTEILKGLSAFAGAPYATLLFRDAYETIYMQDINASSPLFRFGIAIEFGGTHPLMKAYFDLNAARTTARSQMLRSVAELLGDSSGLDLWTAACPGINLNESRVIALDFGSRSNVRAKFYWGARGLTWDVLAGAVRDLSGTFHLDTLRRLNRDVCGASEALSSVLVSMVYSNGGDRSLKLDVCLPQLYANDGDAYEAIERFRSSNVDGHGPSPFDVITGGLDPRTTKRIQQYLGVEMLSDRTSRLNIYYRPIGFETDHMSPHLLPEMCA